MGLTRGDKHKVSEGNATMRWAAAFVEAARLAKVPVVAENPATSKMWLTSRWAKILSSAEVVVLDQCAFGTSWRKATRLASYHVSLDFLGARCGGTRGQCGRTGLPHIRLEGKSDKEFRTKKASKYPEDLCRAVALLARRFLQPHLHTPPPPRAE